MAFGQEYSPVYIGTAWPASPPAGLSDLEWSLLSALGGPDAPENASFAEVAAVAGCSVKQARQIYRRAIRKLDDAGLIRRAWYWGWG